LARKAGKGASDLRDDRLRVLSLIFASAGSVSSFSPMARDDRKREQGLADKYGVPPETIREIRDQGRETSSDFWLGNSEQRMGGASPLNQPMTRRDTPLSLILGGLLLLLILALLLFYRTPRHTNQITQTTTTEDSTVPTITEADTAGIPEMTQADRDSQFFAAPIPVAPEPPVRRAVRRRASTTNRLTTSSSLNAYQTLAELRADGNTRARIRTISRRGVTLYRVDTR
jgi:hypothetical protein